MALLKKSSPAETSLDTSYDCIIIIMGGVVTGGAIYC